MSSGKSVVVPAQIVEVDIINVLDPELIISALDSRQGRQSIINTINENSTQISRILSR